MLRVCPYVGNHWLVLLAKATRDSITGSSTRTPATGASRRARIQSEQADGYGDGQLKKIGCAEQSAGSGEVEGHAPQTGGSVGNGENTIGLNQQQRDNRCECKDHDDIVTEGFDQPVDHQCDHQPLGRPMDTPEADEINRRHHRLDHEPYEYRYYEVDGAVL